MPLIKAVTIDKARMVEPKYSQGPKPIASLESNGANRSKATELKIPPKNQAKTPIFKALIAWPLCAMVYASNTVAIEAAVPGIRNNTAETNPPDTPPI